MLIPNLKIYHILFSFYRCAIYSYQTKHVNNSFINVDFRYIESFSCSKLFFSVFILGFDLDFRGFFEISCDPCL